jgi:hypothetical protein
VLSANPLDAIRPFGLRPAASNVARDNNPFTRALVHTYATRNIGGALTTLGLNYILADAARQFNCCNHG